MENTENTETIIDELSVDNFKNSFIKARNKIKEIDSVSNKTLRFDEVGCDQTLKFFSSSKLIVFINCKINKLLLYGCTDCIFVIKGGVVSGVDVIRSDQIKIFMKGYETYNIDLSLSSNISIRIEKFVIKHLTIYNIASLDNELIFFTCGENILSSNVIHKKIKFISSLIDNFYVYHLVNQKDIYVLNSYSYNINSLLGIPNADNNPPSRGFLFESNIF